MKKITDIILEKGLTRKTFDCTVFPDTECFFCGLCDWMRIEKEYYEE
jgi:hypothetical protein